MSNMTVSAALNTMGPKLISLDSTNKTNMDTISQSIRNYATDATNHTSEGLSRFREFEAFVADVRKSLTEEVRAAKKKGDVLKREKEKEEKKAASKLKKAEEVEAKKQIAERKKKQKAALLNLNRFMKKPVSPIAGKDDTKIQKWGLVGFKLATAPVKKENKRLRTEAKKTFKTVLRELKRHKRFTRGPKNGDYARFCKWKKVIEGEIEEAGFENKRDYNKHLWGVGLGDADSVEWEGPWDDFKKSELAPWNQSQIEC